MRLDRCFAAILFCLFALSFVCTAGATEYTVKKGDTPSKIAKKHGVSVSELTKANHLSAKNLKPGTKITIPGHDGAASKHARKGRDRKLARAQKHPKTAAREPAAKAPGDGQLYHVVRKGETLASVASRYSLTQEELRELNNLRKSRLKRGQRLLVKKIGPKTYIVKKGDTLFKIARKFDMNQDDIRELNELESPELKPGQKLFLEERADEALAESYHELAPNIDEEIRRVSETNEFAEKTLSEKLTVFAKKMLNIPYKFGGNTIFGIDCSAYVKKVYGLLGVNLPRTAREQFKEGEAIDKDELSIGDLVFFRTYASFPSHVGIYMGNNLFIHASSRGRKVTIDSLETPYYVKRFIGGKRLLSEREHEQESEPMSTETSAKYIN